MTPVNTGVTSSLEAATETWPTASAKSSAAIVALASGASGAVGYSDVLIADRENLLDPETT